MDGTLILLVVLLIVVAVAFAVALRSAGADAGAAASQARATQPAGASAGPSIGVSGPQSPASGAQPPSGAAQGAAGGTDTEAPPPAQASSAQMTSPGAPAGGSRADAPPAPAAGPTAAARGQPATGADETSEETGTRPDGGAIYTAGREGEDPATSTTEPAAPATRTTSADGTGPGATPEQGAPAPTDAGAGSRTMELVGQPPTRSGEMRLMVSPQRLPFRFAELLGEQRQLEEAITLARRRIEDVENDPDAGTSENRVRLDVLRQDLAQKQERLREILFLQDGYRWLQQHMAPERALAEA